MRLQSLVLISFLSLLSPVRAVPNEPPAIAVRFEGSSSASPGGLIFAGWTDGTIVWSQDQKKGGPPYQTSKIDPAKFTNLLAKLEKDGVFKKTSDDLFYRGPDASYHQIELLSGKKHIYLESWHEAYEGNNTKTVATSYGLTTLDEGKTREKVLSEDNDSYRAFRKLWSEIRDFTTKLIPDKGEPCKDEPKWELPEWEKIPQ